MVTKLAGWALVAFVAYYLLTNPDGAAGAVLGILGLLQHAAAALSQFATHF